MKESDIERILRRSPHVKACHDNEAYMRAAKEIWDELDRASKQKVINDGATWDDATWDSGPIGFGGSSGGW